jgi:uncharacterized membrane protein
MNDADIRQIWADIGQRLDTQETLIRADRADRRNRAATRSSRWAITGQIGQIAVGALIILFVAGLWARLPTDPIVLLCGVLLHLYGIAAIAVAGRAIDYVRAIDFDKPVLESQLSLARAEKALVVSRLVAGQPWWFLWIAVAVVLLGKAGIGFAPDDAAATMIMLGASVLGMIVTLIVRARLIRTGVIKDPIGRQLAGARRRLDEISQVAQG